MKITSSNNIPLKEDLEKKVWGSSFMQNRWCGQDFDTWIQLSPLKMFQQIKKKIGSVNKDKRNAGMNKLLLSLKKFETLTERDGLGRIC